MKLFFKSFTYAWKGLLLCLKQRNMRVMMTCAVLAIALGFALQIDLTDWCFILLCIGGVLALEAMNTAIESFVDLVQPELHPLAGRIKDISAGAVFFFSIISAIVGALIFGKYILDLFL
ncbi:MAG: diacylglycerol kinase family protein [Bacteroidota bacterium]